VVGAAAYIPAAPAAVDAVIVAETALRGKHRKLCKIGKAALAKLNLNCRH